MSTKRGWGVGTPTNNTWRDRTHNKNIKDIFFADMFTKIWQGVWDPH